MSNLESDPATSDLSSVSSATHGFRGVVACQAAGISYRQLDYWARTGLVMPSVRNATGSGSARLYSFTDILLLKVIRRFLDAGVSLQNIRKAVDHLIARGIDQLSSITLMSDGVSIYECSSSDEVYDIIQGGQGVFGIAIGKVWDEVEGTLVTLEREFSTHDELAARRRVKGA